MGAPLAVQVDFCPLLRTVGSRDSLENHQGTQIIIHNKVPLLINY